ncbi:MAG: hypothetical protein RLZZ330_169, partial [Actinomycetota bacterium]
MAHAIVTIAVQTIAVVADMAAAETVIANQKLVTA